MPNLVDDAKEEVVSETQVISLDGANIPSVIVDPDEIQSLLDGLGLTAPFGYTVEKVKISYTLAAKV